VVLRTFKELGAINVFIAELNPGGTIHPVNTFGFTQEQIDSWRESSAEERIPTADALRNNSFVWLADKDDWYRDYPDLAEYAVAVAETFICWPIHIRGAYMSVIGVAFNKVLLPDPELKNFFEIVSGLMGMQISAKRRGVNAADPDASIWNLLSNRQYKIVRLMVQGQTNNQIADELGYSQSTIRQETIKIYETLGVAGRKGAIAAYRAHFPIYGNQLDPSKIGA
jgi:DNA-binding CsgD family transcriptional regulator